MRNLTKRVATLGITLAVLVSHFTMSAAVIFTEWPSVASSGDISDGTTISIVDASSESFSSFVVHMDNSDTIDSAEVTIDFSNPDRDHVVYSADGTAGEYSMTADVDTDSDSSTDSDEHT